MEIYKRKDIPWRLIAEEAIVVNPKTSLIYPLNTVGAKIWQLLDGEKNISDIIDAMEKEFDAGRDTLESDVTDFIHELEAAGLIEKL